MIVAGAGGHALELLDLIPHGDMSQLLLFFDNINKPKLFIEKFKVINDEKELKSQLLNDNRFILGIGNPISRYKLYQLFTKYGGILTTIKSPNSSYSFLSDNFEADIFNLCFIGAYTKIGKGTLINTGAQIHHETRIGDFCEINPGAILLGKVHVGDFTSIGANATILPKIHIGSNVIIGAGSVVTKDVQDGAKIIGVPGKIV